MAPAQLELFKFTLCPSPFSSSSSSSSSSLHPVRLPASRRLASSNPLPANTSPALTATEQHAAAQLDWPTYLALRRSQRLWGLIASIPTTLIGFSAGAGYFVRPLSLSLSSPSRWLTPPTRAPARRPPSKPTRPAPSSGSSPSSSTAPQPSAASASAGSQGPPSAAPCGA